MGPDVFLDSRAWGVIMFHVIIKAGKHEIQETLNLSHNIVAVQVWQQCFLLVPMSMHWQQHAVQEK